LGKKRPERRASLVRTRSPEKLCEAGGGDVKEPKRKPKGVGRKKGVLMTGGERKHKKGAEFLGRMDGTVYHHCIAFHRGEKKKNGLNQGNWPGKGAEAKGSKNEPEKWNRVEKAKKIIFGKTEKLTV